MGLNVTAMAAQRAQLQHSMPREVWKIFEFHQAIGEGDWPETVVVHSVRVDAQWRICFVWRDGGAEDVELIDYH